MNRAGFDTTSSTAHPDVVAVRGPSTLENQKSKIRNPKPKIRSTYVVTVVLRAKMPASRISMFTGKRLSTVQNPPRKSKHFWSLLRGNSPIATQNW